MADACASATGGQSLCAAIAHQEPQSLKHFLGTSLLGLIPRRWALSGKTESGIPVCLAALELS